MSEWQPIETAPKDGCFIVCSDDRSVCPCQSRDGHRVIQNMPGFANWEYGEIAVLWQPLPEPPK